MGVFPFSGILPETLMGVCVAQDAQSVGEDAEEDSAAENDAVAESDAAVTDVSDETDAEDSPGGEVTEDEKAAGKKESPKSAGTAADGFQEKATISDVRLQAVKTLELPQERQEEAKKLAAEFVTVFCKNATLEHEAEFLSLEAQRVAGLSADGGSLRRFLADMSILTDDDFPEFAVLGKPLTRAIITGSTPAVQDVRQAVEKLDKQLAAERAVWQELHNTLVERQFLLFEIESNRHVVTQLASMMSVDKRWFWLFGVAAFGALVAASFHERRHEIRRWLNGGKARQMGLSKILLGCFLGLLAVTLTAFIFGETIYRAMLDVTFSTTSPRLVCRHQIGEESAKTAEFLRKNEEAKREHSIQKEAWKLFATENLPQGTQPELLKQWNLWRDTIGTVYVRMCVLKDVSDRIETDRKQLLEINGKLSAVSGETLHFLRYKHLLRMMLGFFLLTITFLGIAYFWAEVNRRRKHVFMTCPQCLEEGCLKPWENDAGGDRRWASGEDAAEESSAPQPLSPSVPEFVVCTHIISQSPHEECGYRFAGVLQPLTKLSFPTLGIPQVGKTHWLTMLYWELKNGYYPHLGFLDVPSSVTEEMDRRVDEIMNARIGTAATQRDRIPQPLVLKYRDKDRLGRTELLANIFDYSGEITTDTPLEDPRRKRALSSDGFFFFLDPIYPWQPQAEALARFRKDMETLTDLDAGESLHLPIAICLTKIDLLPLVTTLADAEEEAIRFYETLGRIDPTGEALNKTVIDARSEVTDELRKKIWPQWDVEQQVKELFGGRHKFFPLTPVGLDGAGETDLRRRTISPFGLVEPLAWLLEMSGYTTLE